MSLSLLPSLEEINPAIRQCRRRLAANAAMDEGFLSMFAENWYESHVKRDAGSRPVLKVKDLRGLEDAIFYRVVRLAFADAGLSSDI